ncbi:MAG TPA: trehalose-6-phosphate synthase, partial [Desulfuromonadales bacterium]|nr:trehalose-6-phosphate synthase [Desulfuromonadales bacterium]
MGEQEGAKKRLIVVSNRLPVVIGEQDGELRVVPGSGGLVTALAPVVRRGGGVWVGWPGCDDRPEIGRLLDDFSVEQGYRLVPVPLTDEEVERYYRGFSNEALWPLFHDLL